MPCRDDWGYEAFRNDSQLRDRLDLATQVACELADVVMGDYKGTTVPLSQKAQNWIAKHRAADERRKQEEQLEEFEEEQEGLIKQAKTLWEAWEITKTESLLDERERLQSRISELDCLIDDLRLKLDN